MAIKTNLIFLLAVVLISSIAIVESDSDKAKTRMRRQWMHPMGMYPGGGMSSSGSHSQASSGSMSGSMGGGYGFPGMSVSGSGSQASSSSGSGTMGMMGK